MLKALKGVLKIRALIGWNANNGSFKELNALNDIGVFAVYALLLRNLINLGSNGKAELDAALNGTVGLHGKGVLVFANNTDVNIEVVDLLPGFLVEALDNSRVSY